MNTPMKENLGAHVFAALDGAAYHLSMVDEAIRNPLMESSLDIDKHPNDEAKVNVRMYRNMMHWHIRGFFWELVATFETLLQWANIRYGLRLVEDQVRAPDVRRKASKDREVWKEKYEAIEKVWVSDWYFEVQQYRNSAHRSFQWITFEYQILKDEKDVEYSRLMRAWLRQARDGQQHHTTDLLPALSRYLKEMRTLVMEVLEVKLDEVKQS